MSLNGVDSTSVAQAHETALASDGGWLLLNYTSRDEVALYKQGADGLEELRHAIHDYPEKSPLYAFLHWEGKKAVIKYVPEGTSRLLQVRTNVHFQAVSHKLSPHDATVEASSIADVSDAKLHEACGLEEDASEDTENTESVENSEDTVRAEEVEKASDGTPSPKERTESQASQESRKDHVGPTDNTKSVNMPAIPRPSTAKRHGAAAELQAELDDIDKNMLGAELKAKEARPKSNDIMGMKAFLTEVTPPHTPGHSKTQPPSIPVYGAPQTYGARMSEDLPKTSYSSRPSTSDIWRNWRPKMRFGPRPVESVAEPHPVERQKLPTGYKAKSQKQEKEERPKSRRSEKSIRDKAGSRERRLFSRQDSKHSERHRTAREDAPPPVPPLTTQFRKPSAVSPNLVSPDTPSPQALPQVPLSAKLPQASSGFAEGRELRRPPAIGITAPPSSSPDVPVAPKSAPAISPEKQRLMRALQMRKQQQQQAKLSSEEPPVQKIEPKVDSREATPDIAGPTQADSGVDMESPRVQTETGRSSPTTAQKALRMKASRERFNPLQSHPINTEITLPIPRRPNNNSPSSSLNSNKELPALPKEAQEEQIKQKNHVIPSRTIQDPQDHERPAKRRKSSEVADKPSKTPEAVINEPEQDPLKEGSVADDIETAKIEDATSLQMPPGLHDRNQSSNSNYVTAVSVNTSSNQGELSSPRSRSREHERTPTPERFPKPPGSSAQVRRYPSNSSRQRTNKFSDSAISTKRANMSSGISRRIQALAEISQRDGREVMDSASSFLAPSALSNDPYDLSTRGVSPFGHAYEDNRSRSPNRSSRMTGMRQRASFDDADPTTNKRRSDSKTGYRKRDSLTVTAHIMRPHHQQMQQISAMTPSIDEERESAGDPQDALQALAGRERPFSSVDADRPPSVVGGRGRLTFSRRESDSNGSDAVHRRPGSRGSAVSSGIGRNSFDGWRGAFSGFGAAARERRESRSNSRPNNLFRVSTHENGQIPENDEPVMLDRVDEVSEPGTRASMLSRFSKRFSSQPVQQDKGSIQNGKGFEHVRSKKVTNQASTNLLANFKKPGKSIVVGDVNVQFPDTLLWKRRWIEIDDHGNLVFSPPKSSNPNEGRMVNAGAVNVRRFHLSEFKQPVVPSREREEMKHSVVLDFLEGGGTLQLASEDRVQQGALVKRLVDVHRAWRYDR